MPPPKFKLHKNMGKARPEVSKVNNTSTSLNSQSTSSGTSETVPNLTGLTTEQEEQFQCELYWCIKQLQNALSTDKLSKKQVEEHTKTLNTLMSHNAPMIKKRQIMRLSFGDYRKKMIEDEKKAKRINIKVSAAKPSKKSMFLKKAFTSGNTSNFQFNFPVPEEAIDKKQQSNDPNSTIVQNANSQTNYAGAVFSKSDNSFRFNFLTDNNENPTEN